MYPEREKLGPRDRLLEEAFDEIEDLANLLERHEHYAEAKRLDQLAALLFSVGWIDTPPKGEGRAVIV